MTVNIERSKLKHVEKSKKKKHVHIGECDIEKLQRAAIAT